MEQGVAPQFPSELFESLPLSVIAFDRDWRIVYLNAQAEQTTGRLRAELLGNVLWESFPDLIGTSLEREYRHAVAAREPVRLDFYWELSRRWYEIRTTPWNDGLIAYYQDVTERTRAEQAQRFLSEASALLAASLDYETTLATVARLAVPGVADWCAVDVLGDDGELRRVATAHADPERVAWAEEIGRRYPPDPAASGGLHEVLRTGRPAFYPEITDEMLVGGARDAEHLELLRAVGFSSVMMVPLSAHGRAFGVITLATAESRRRFESADLALAEELARRAGLAIDNAKLYFEAREANRLKDEFLATLSHELRTPLNAILGWASMLRGGTLDETVRARGLGAIERNAKAQAHLVDDLLDVSRAISGKLQIETSEVDLRTVAAEAVAAARPAAHAKSIELRAEIGNAGAVTGDADRLRQVVWNLLSNAIKFTPAGGRVTLRVSRRGSDAQIVVSDSGAGIDAEFLPYVFERFTQADGTTTRTYGGLGLGLAMVRHLVELHGGTVAVESAGVGRGATFTVRLPLRSSTAAPAAVAPGEAALDGCNLLVVDDEPDSLEMLRTALEYYGATVRTAESAEKAFAAIREAPPDLVIADIAMPDEDGYSLVQRMRALDDERRRAVPAVALTALARDEDRDRARDVGFDEFVTKPIDPATLVDVALRTLRRRQPDAGAPGEASSSRSDQPG